MSSRKTLVAIPAWNEEGSIAEVIGRIQLHEPDVDILVVNDGSTDSTAQVASAAGAVVVSFPFNVGVGGAMRTGFFDSFRQGHQTIVQNDVGSQQKLAHVTSKGQPLSSDEESFETEIAIPELLVAAGDGTTS